MSKRWAVASQPYGRAAQRVEAVPEPELALFAAVADHAITLGSVDVVLAPGLVQTVARSGSAGGSPMPRALGEVIRSEQVVDAGTVFSASIAADYVEALVRAFTEAGATISRITTSDFAWAEAARHAVGSERVIVAVGVEDLGELRVLAVEDGAPMAWRRLPIGSDEATLSEAVIALVGDGDDIRTVVLGDEELRARVANASGQVGGRLSGAGTRLEELSFDPAAVAAAFAGTGPSFVPPAIEAAARSRNRRVGFATAAAAVTLLVGAGAVDLMDLRVEAEAIRSARMAHSAQVTEALDAQASLTGRLESVDALEDVRRGTPRWTVLLSAVADALPAATYLTGFRASADSVYLDLEGSEVADAVDRLRRIPWWTGLRAASAVQTELSDDGSVVERLTVAARPTWERLNENGGGLP